MDKKSSAPQPSTRNHKRVRPQSSYGTNEISKELMDELMFLEEEVKSNNL